MIKLLRPKYLVKFLWFGFGLAGLAVLAKQYFPDFPQQVKNSPLVEGVQTGLAESTQTGDFSSSDPTQLDLSEVDPQTAQQIITQVVKEEVTRIIKQSSETVKEFPATQVRKIKIGACEELLEEDICAVAQDLDCAPSD